MVMLRSLLGLYLPAGCHQKHFGAAMPNEGECPVPFYRPPGSFPDMPWSPTPSHMFIYIRTTISAQDTPEPGGEFLQEGHLRRARLGGTNYSGDLGEAGLEDICGKKEGRITSVNLQVCDMNKQKKGSMLVGNEEEEERERLRLTYTLATAG